MIKFKLLVVFILSLSLFFTPFNIYAQTTIRSNPWSTEVGDSLDEDPAIGGGNAGILKWAKEIVDILEKGGVVYPGNYNVFDATLTNGDYTAKAWPNTIPLTADNLAGNLFWCTYLIIDAYNLAGFAGLTRNPHAGVIAMRKWWKTAPGYIHLDYEADKQITANAKPSYAMFWESKSGEHTSFEHVGIIEEIEVDENGNGYIKTLESNSSAKSREIQFRNWNIPAKPYPVRGFGGLAQ